MFEIDIIISLIIMGLIFYRHLSIYKEPFKIDYAPLLLAVGALATLFHFLITSDENNFSYHLRESLVPLFSGVIFYLVMNVLHQSQKTKRDRMLEFRELEKEKEMHAYRSTIHQLLDRFDKKMTQFEEQEQKRADAFKESFSKDFKSLETVAENQYIFVQKIEKIALEQENISKNIENFIGETLPSQDKILHDHIDRVHIQESEYYKKVILLLDTFNKRLEEVTHLDQKFEAIIPTLNSEIDKILHKTEVNLSDFFRRYEKSMQHLKSQSESISLSLTEYESHLEKIKEQSELFLKQTILLSNKMEELSENTFLYNKANEEIEGIITKVTELKKEYIRSKMALDDSIEAITNIKEEDVNMSEKCFNEIYTLINDKLDTAIEELGEKHNEATNELTTSLKAKMLQGYSTQSDI